MIDLSLDLAPELYPLAWVIGDWRGWGTVPALDEAQDSQYIIQETSIKAVGSGLSQTTLTWLAAPSSQAPSMMADAPTGLRQLERGSLLWREESNWEITASTPATKETEACCRALIKTSGGHAEQDLVWQASSLGPRIMAGVQWDGLQLSRMFGLVGGELFWACEKNIDAETTPIYSARLARCEDPILQAPNALGRPSLEVSPEDVIKDEE